ncbi:MAG: hypothetical protein ABSH15_01275 [Verrucomicrobiota bacterium]|jgi:hypothetical protein
MNYIDISKQAPADPEKRKEWRRENYKRIAASPKLVLNGISDDETLRRFIDLPKLFDLLKNKRLLMPTLGKLMVGDPFECWAKKSFDQLDRAALEGLAKQLEEYAPTSSYFPINYSNPFDLSASKPEPQFDSDIKQMTLEQLKDAVWYLERERLKNNLVCSCWHKGDIESDAMWKIYASQLGVSISSSAARMKSGIKMIVPKIYEEHAELHLSAVHYEEDTNDSGNFEPWLIKRKAFVHEKEVRLYCDVPFAFASKFELEIDIPKFIEEIVISPFTTAWQVPGLVGAIEALLKEIGAGQIPVRQSRHMRVPKIGWPTITRLQEGEIYRPIIGDLN